ncbi:MAG: magnesium and cobalt transport protein CorA [Thermoprotei archaeon]|nr:MAG: magnesium and cobalt transport protein CorA [Thermoprotei archaeon]
MVVMGKNASSIMDGGEGKAELLLVGLGKPAKQLTLSSIKELGKLTEGFKPFWLLVRDASSDLVNELIYLLNLPKSVAKAITKPVPTRTTSVRLRKYRNLLFLTLEYVKYVKGPASISFNPVYVIVSKDYIVTIVSSKAEPTTHLIDRVREEPTNVFHLLYLLLDEIINSYFSVLELISEWIEALEDGVITGPRQYHLRRVQVIKRKLMFLRRSSWRLREVVREILGSEFLSTNEEPYKYIQDLYDNVLEIVDIAESCRERIADLLNMYLTSISNKLNEIMKFLTIIGTIFIPLTFITGIYGMNFNTKISPWNMPELNYPYGYPLVLVAMAIIGAVMLIYFKKKRWI